MGEEEGPALGQCLLTDHKYKHLHSNFLYTNSAVLHIETKKEGGVSATVSPLLKKESKKAKRERETKKALEEECGPVVAAGENLHRTKVRRTS